MLSHLSDQGCETRLVADPASTLAAAQALWPDVVVVNALGGTADPVEVCAALDRSNLELPRLVVYESGPIPAVRAHAYLEQPITPRRLSNRVKKALGTQAGRFVRAGDVCVDLLRRNVKCSNGVAHLTPKEAALLGHLMRHAGQVVSRVELMHEIWETDYLGDMRTVEVHIRWLRSKIEPDPKHPRRILTVRRQGYLFRPHEEGGE
jgi:DNA-binding response OmpR family regulator